MAARFAAGNLKPDLPKKTSLLVTPHPDEQVPVRLAAVLKFSRKEVASGLGVRAMI